MGKKLKDEDLVLNIVINGSKSRKEMNDLSRQLRDTNKEINALKKSQKEAAKEQGKESEAYKAVTAAIKEKQTAVASLQSRLAELRKGMKVTELNTQDLRKEFARLKGLRDLQIYKSENWNAFNDQLKKVKDRLNEVKDGAEQTGFNLQNIANKFNHYIGVITAGILTLVGVISGLKDINKTFAEFDDKVADVMKTTGLAKMDVRELNEEFKEIDTRTQQEDLLGLARIAGKLGIEGKNDILEFVKAADQINVALSEDLGGDVEEAINEIGKLVEIFSLREEFGLGGAILKIGSAINELGANSSANEAFLVNFTKRMAGVAPAAKMSIASILGLAATLDQLGQTEEVSATALNDVIPSMFKDTATFARIAGMEIDAFSQLLNKDANEALIKVLEGVKGNNASFGEMVARLDEIGIDGSRATTVLGALAGKIDVLRAQQALANKAIEEGTSLTDEYNIKNNTAAANLDRAKKGVYNMTVELGEKLNPVMTGSTSLFVMLLKILQVLLTFLIDFRKIIVTTTASIIAYNVVVAINNALTKESILLTKLNAAWTATYNFALKAARGSVLLFAAAQALATGNLARATAAMRLFNLTVTANPIGLLIAAIAGLLTALYMYSGRLTAAQKAQQALIDTEVEAQKSIISQKVELERLLKTARDKTKSDQERMAAIRALNELSPEYLGFLNLENINTDKATSATNNYIESLLKLARVKAAQAKLEELESKRIELDLKGAEPDTWEKITSTFLGSLVNNRGMVAVGIAKAHAEATKRAIDDINKMEDALRNYIERNETKMNKSEATSTGNNPFVQQLTADQIKAREKFAREAKSRLEQEKLAHEDRLKEVGLFNKKREDMTAADLKTLADLERIYQQNIKSINDKAAKDREKELEKERQQAEYRAEVVNSQKSKIEQENIAHQERLKKAGITNELKIEKGKIAAYDALRQQHQANLDKIDAEAITQHLAKLDKQYKKALQALQIKNNLELAEVTTLEQAKAMLRGTLSKGELDEIKTLNDAKEALREKYNQDEQRLTKDQMNKLVVILETALKTGDIEGLHLSDHIFSEEEFAILQDRLGLAKEEFAKMMASLRKPGDSGKEKEKPKDYSFKNKTDILGMSPEDWELFHGHLKAGKFGIDEMIVAVQALSQAWSAYHSYLTAVENRQLQKYEQGVNQKKAALDRQLDAGKISQEAYHKAVEKLDLDLDAKKAVIQQKQAKREKAIQIMSAIAGTASAVVAALGSKPWTPFNMVLAGIVGAMGAAQVATIAATPVPGLEEGGYADVTREQDGKRFRARRRARSRGFIQRPSILVSENGEEFVASADAVRNSSIRPMLDIIDTAQRNGTVSTLNMEKILSTYALTKKIAGRQSGGYVSGADQAPAGSGSGDEMVAQLMQVVAANHEAVQLLLKRLARPITANVSLLGNNGIRKKMDELNQLEEDSSL